MRSRSNSVRRTLTALATLLASSSVSRSEDWPQFRGPDADGVASSTAPPVRWDQKTNIAWSTAVPGTGHSSPIVIGDQVFLTTAEPTTGERLLLSYDRQTGRERWRRVIAVAQIEPMHAKNTPASSTPAAADGLVITNFAADGEYLVSATDFDGEPAWSRSLGPFVSRHGFHAPPTIVEDSIILGGLHDSDDSFVARLRVADGSVIWKTPSGTSIRSFSPPHVTGQGNERSVVVSGANQVNAFDYETGEPLWSLNGPAEKTVSAIVEANGLLYVAGGRDSRLLAIDPRGEGDIVWASTSGVPYVSSPVIFHGDIFMLSDRGVATRVALEDGDTLEKRRFLGPTSASPIVAAGRLYTFDENGKAIVAVVEERLRTVATNDLGEPIFATPAFVGDQIFIRTTSKLYCVQRPRLAEAD